MRIRIVADSATQQQAYNLTLAFQRTLAFELPTNLTPEHGEAPAPTVTVGGSAMGWKSPYLTHEHARALMREFSRLEAGLFDHGGHDCSTPGACEVSR